MIFNFIKYLQPTHYFQHLRDDGSSIFPVIESVPDDVLLNFPEDDRYLSQHAKDYDRSWRLIKSGYISDINTYSDFGGVPIRDEYMFIKKNFHPIWSLYVLIFRVLLFNNPYREFKAWKYVQKKSIVREEINPLHIMSEVQFSKLKNFDVFVSVIIPTLNRYDYLYSVLKDFEKQSHKKFELIIVDQSSPFDKEFYDQFELNIYLIQQDEKALWLARNSSIKAAKAKFLAFSEDDVRIESDWIERHLECLSVFDADISAGVFYPENSSIPHERSFYAIASQFATGNAMVKRKVFEKVGLFDRQFEKQRMGDGEFGLRAYLHRFKCISNPYACCVDVKASTGGLRELGSWDAFRPKKIFAPRPIPSVLYLYRRYFGFKNTLRAIFKDVPPSIVPYRYKRNKKMLLIGIILSFLLLPIIIVQVCLSWHQSGKMIKKGPLIGEL